ncbi:MAG: hypothetical protein PF488_04790 [Patescibacteria group bacterium]|jgi:hypothetical protein|nr:hypothetical protein [Patescibacteria group bacterium]
MNKFENNVSMKLDEIIHLLKGEERPLELEGENFKINSDGWKKITVDGEKYLVNPEKDVWELLSGECKGEQLFTYDSAMRETKKRGKIIPTNAQLEELLKDKEVLRNVKYPGLRLTNDSYYLRGVYLYLWSSSESSSTLAWGRAFSYSRSTVYRVTFDKGYGFSVRCLLDTLN